jgi:predicted RNA-binding protein Jag
MNVPENHVVTEGRSLRAAIDAASELLGVPAAQVEHKIDIKHFRSAIGAGVGADTVKIYAWAKEQIIVPGLAEGESWMKGLLQAMKIEGKVQASASKEGVSIQLDVGEAARHLVGKRGTTLRAIQHLLGLAMENQHPRIQFQLDVSGGDREEHRRFDSPRHDSPRHDSPRYESARNEGSRHDSSRYEGPRHEHREGREDRRRDFRDDRRRSGDRPRRDRGGEEEELKKLARKLAQRVLATGEPEVIRRELNSYDRRVVHLEIAMIQGVASRSVGEGHERRLEIIPAEQKEQSSEESVESSE